ncbi:MAG: alkaline phosphatase family protein [Bryobacterales bacterium]|nr:alkaline phosphatase family protein [Bryobacterales bacterium]
MKIPLLLGMLLASYAHAETRRPLLVISVDGLDHRYLRDADRLGLKIPNIRRLTKEGEWADGVLGVVPTVTWPSHTTLITGVTPAQHGILGNRRPASEGGDYYWSANLLKVPTLWHLTRKAGLKSAAITWPVTVDADIDYNLPEAFGKRNGGAMDLATIEAKATPGLVAEITKAFPAFPHEWMDDRSRTLATVFLLKQKKPDLILLHLVDHDSEAHEAGPFTRDALGILEYTDELVGQMVAAAGKQYVVALVSDHGFERMDKVIHVPALLAQKGLQADVQVTPFWVLAKDEKSAGVLRGLQLGREIPKDEVRRFAPALATAAALIESAPHTMFGNGRDTVEGKPREVGTHGMWPSRRDFRATFLLWGNGVKARKTPEISMLEIYGRFKTILGL